MEKEYYIPEIEDLFVGYECEIKVPIRIKERWKISDFVSGKIASIFPNFEWMDFQNTCHSFDNTFKLEIRTQYLSKEQIENEGWEFETDNDDIQTFLKGRNRLIYSYFSRILWLDDAVRGGQIAGGVKCPSINEFRKIFKLLSF